MKTGSTDSRRTTQAREAIDTTSDGTHDLQEALDSVGIAIKEYSKKHPAAVAVGIFFVGFYVGWKVKPW